MTTDELKAAASAILSEYPPSEFVRKFSANAIHRIATIERERDEARAEFCELLDVAVRGGRGVTDEIRERFQDRPEWRKGGD